MVFTLDFISKLNRSRLHCILGIHNLFFHLFNPFTRSTKNGNNKAYSANNQNHRQKSNQNFDGNNDYSNNDRHNHKSPQNRHHRKLPIKILSQGSLPYSYIIALGT